MYKHRYDRGRHAVNGKPLDSSFQRKTGYVQQQDLHLETTTIREALDLVLCFASQSPLQRKKIRISSRR